MKHRFYFAVILCVVSITIVAFGNTAQKKPYQPGQGMVPDEKTALKIAEAIWLPVYGENINGNKPFTATLKNDSIWVVTGTLPKGMKGGTPYIEIQRKDCKILALTHGK
jgi:hypothetical protein